MIAHRYIIALALAALCPAAPLWAAPDAVGTALEQTFQPETRAQGIAALEQLLPTLAEGRHVRLALARALSWEGRLDDSLRHYDQVLQDTPAGERAEIDLERLQVLLWQGRLEVAAAGYKRLLAAQPRTPGALVGLARIHRWQGQPLAAVRAARQALALAPDHAEARQEAAFGHVDLGMPYAARAALGQADAPAELAERLRRARRPAVALAVTGAADSFGVDRIATRAKIDLVLPRDVHLAVGTGLSHLQQAGASLQYRIAAGALALEGTHLQIGAGGAVYQGDDLLLGAARAWLRVRVSDRFGLTIGARRRPMMEGTDPLATGEDSFFGAGAGGASDIGAVARRGVDDLSLALQLTPLAASYVYADGRGFASTDGNRGYSLAAGLGVDLVRLLGAKAPIALLARADSYLVGYREQRAEYFSPARFDSHVAGGQVRWQPASFLRLSAHGGRTFSVGSASAPGWTAGGGMDWRLGGWTLAARAEYRDDIYYRVRRGWLAVSGRL